MTFTVEERDGQVWLTLSGPEGTKDLVREIWLSGRSSKRSIERETSTGSGRTTE